MPFLKNFPMLARYHAMLESLPNPMPIQSVVRDSINHLLENIHTFNEHISHDSPFVHEFFTIIEREDASYDNCFSLLECLATFFREKVLRHKAEPAPMENSLLTHFERSGEWNPTDDSLVSRWYWLELPQRHR